jgi:hypothetical protein
MSPSIHQAVAVANILKRNTVLIIPMKSQTWRPRLVYLPADIHKLITKALLESVDNDLCIRNRLRTYKIHVPKIGADKTVPANITEHENHSTDSVIAGLKTSTTKSTEIVMSWTKNGTDLSDVSYTRLHDTEPQISDIPRNVTSHNYGQSPLGITPAYINKTNKTVSAYHSEIPGNNTVTYHNDSLVKTPIAYHNEIPTTTEIIYQNEIRGETTAYQNEIPNKSITTYHNDITVATTAAYHNEIPIKTTHIGTETEDVTSAIYKNDLETTHSPVQPTSETDESNTNPLLVEVTPDGVTTKSLINNSLTSDATTDSGFLVTDTENYTTERNTFSTEQYTETTYVISSATHNLDEVTTYSSAKQTLKYDDEYDIDPHHVETGNEDKVSPHKFPYELTADITSDNSLEVTNTNLIIKKIISKEPIPNPESTVTSLGTDGKEIPIVNVSGNYIIFDENLMVPYLNESDFNDYEIDTRFNERIYEDALLNSEIKSETNVTTILSADEVNSNVNKELYTPSTMDRFTFPDDITSNLFNQNNEHNSNVYAQDKHITESKLHGSYASEGKSNEPLKPENISDKGDQRHTVHLHRISDHISDVAETTPLITKVTSNGSKKSGKPLDIVPNNTKNLDVGSVKENEFDKTKRTTRNLLQVTANGLEDRTTEPEIVTVGNLLQTTTGGSYDSTRSTEFVTARNLLQTTTDVLDHSTRNPEFIIARDLLQTTTDGSDHSTGNAEFFTVRNLLRTITDGSDHSTRIHELVTARNLFETINDGSDDSTRNPEFVTARNLLQTISGESDDSIINPEFVTARNRLQTTTDGPDHSTRIHDFVTARSLFETITDGSDDSTKYHNFVTARNLLQTTNGLLDDSTTNSEFVTTRNLLQTTFLGLDESKTDPGFLIASNPLQTITAVLGHSTIHPEIVTGINLLQTTGGLDDSTTKTELLSSRNVVQTTTDGLDDSKINPGSATVKNLMLTATELTKDIEVVTKISNKINPVATVKDVSAQTANHPATQNYNIVIHNSVTISPDDLSNPSLPVSTTSSVEVTCGNLHEKMPKDSSDGKGIEHFNKSNQAVTEKVDFYSKVGHVSHIDKDKEANTFTQSTEHISSLHNSTIGDIFEINEDIINSTDFSDELLTMQILYELLLSKYDAAQTGDNIDNIEKSDGTNTTSATTQNEASTYSVNRSSSHTDETLKLLKLIPGIMEDPNFYNITDEEINGLRETVDYIWSTLKDETETAISNNFTATHQGVEHFMKSNAQNRQVEINETRSRRQISEGLLKKQGEAYRPVENIFEFLIKTDMHNVSNGSETETTSHARRNHNSVSGQSVKSNRNSKGERSSIWYTGSDNDTGNEKSESESMQKSVEIEEPVYVYKISETDSFETVPEVDETIDSNAMKHSAIGSSTKQNYIVGRRTKKVSTNKNIMKINTGIYSSRYARPNTKEKERRQRRAVEIKEAGSSSNRTEVGPQSISRISESESNSIESIAVNVTVP